MKMLQRITSITSPSDSPKVVKTVINELTSRISDLKSELSSGGIDSEQSGSFFIGILPPEKLVKACPDETDVGKQFALFRIAENGAGVLAATVPSLLYAAVCYLIDNIDKHEDAELAKGVVITPAFEMQRVAYDYYLTQEARITRGLDRHTYIKALAKMGVTHAEVNGLGYPMAIETGPKGETYPMFYTYCPALDQFVFSKLNEGLYPNHYLSANLTYLKQNAKLARKYGMTPGMLCFEPRSVPEQFFDKYPMLRGCRLDHPFRSFRPRYNMTITHPLVREHYAEMMRKVLKEIPDLGFINIWTNDSGAGFEHTKSLYVGRNGGAYLIREWKDDAEIARLAGENALLFFKTLLDAGREINPDFRVITRMESFYGEHDTVWNGLGDGLEIETNSLATKGWAMNYRHPRYPDTDQINGGSIYQQGFDPAESELQRELEERGSHAHFYFGAGPQTMFAPLIGVPYPRLTWQRLKTLRDNGVSHLVQYGGTFPPEKAPYNINHEISRRFTFNPELDIDTTISEIASGWTGETMSPTLVKAWKLAEEAIISFPNTSTLYATIGFTWYRLWARPIVPNIEAIDPAKREYYERFMCTTPHNPNNVDFSRDVLFTLMTPKKALLSVQRMDDNVWAPLDEAIELLKSAESVGLSEFTEKCTFRDQKIRLKALRCWMMTHRTIAAWVAGVYGYINAKDEVEKKRWKKYVKDAIRMEIDNTKMLARILETDIEFMTLTDQGETPLVYGDNLRSLLEFRVELMAEHLDDVPYIDPNYVERKAGEPVI